MSEFAYLRRDDGVVFAFTEALAQRRDMKPLTAAEFRNSRGGVSGVKKAAPVAPRAPKPPAGVDDIAGIEALRGYAKSRHNYVLPEKISEQDAREQIKALEAGQGG